MTKLEKKAERLARILSKGKWNYILWHCLLGWGLMAAVVYSLFQYVSDAEPTLLDVILNLVLFPLCGACMGLLQWPFMTAEYARLRSKM